jgi:NADH dehydrogenase [ubiquinone] 1 alpha subcomplex assembly factor 5
MVTGSQIEVFDRQLLKQKRARVAGLKKDYSFLSEWAASQLLSRLDDIKRSFPVTAEIGHEIDPQNIARLKKDGRITGFSSIDIDDHEHLPAQENSLDLALSVLNFHSINDLPGCLMQIRRALKPDGLMLAAMLGGETLYELRQSLLHAEMMLKGGASPRVFPFADKQQMGALLQRAGFALPVVDSDIVTVTYSDIFKLMHDLRGMGESNVIRERSRQNPGKEFFRESADYYHAHFSQADGTIKASFEVIFLAGWAPHESQQKPLRPGSAEKSLASALGTEEVSAGEKIGEGTAS